MFFSVFIYIYIYRYIYIYIYIYICVEILRNNKFHYIRVDKIIYKYVIFNIIYIEYM